MFLDNGKKYAYGVTVPIFNNYPKHLTFVQDNNMLFDRKYDSIIIPSVVSGCVLLISDKGRSVNYASIDRKKCIFQGIWAWH